jgi:hypothetical protein
MTTEIAFGYYNLKAKEINVSAIPQITTQKGRKLMQRLPRLKKYLGDQS